MKVTIRSKTANVPIECEPHERILYAALRAGLDVPYECSTGTCGTCKARARPGTVGALWLQAPGLTTCKAERGEFLMCQGSALGDCEILVPARVQATDDAAIRPAYLSGSMRDINALTHDVLSFRVALEQPVAFVAGQFVVLSIDGIDGYRAYSMTSFAPLSDTLDLVIKRKPGGGFSDWMGSVRNGAAVKVFGPLGKATFSPSMRNDIVGIAGGSGIAGIMSILSHATASSHFEASRGAVFFGVRTREDVFFMDELAALVESASGKLSVTVAFSDEPDAARDARVPDCIQIDHGFVHEVAAKRMAGEWTNTTAFVAGPPPMVDGTLRLLVTEAGLSPADIRYDKFG